MVLAEARRLDIGVRVLDPSSDAPCRLGAQQFTLGSFQDYDTVLAFAQGADAVAIEIESVNADALEALEAQGIPCFPQSHVLRVIQNKVAQKQFYADHQLPTSEFQRFASKTDLLAAIEAGTCAYPFVWKLGEGGYDGFGVSVVRSAEDAAALA